MEYKDVDFECYLNVGEKVGMRARGRHTDRNYISDTFIEVVKDIRIESPFLIISGTVGPKEVAYRYLIQDYPDCEPVSRPAPKEKPTEKPKEKPVRKPVSKPSTKKTPKMHAVSAKKGITYEVRVSGSIRGSYSSKAKAEAHKRNLKSKGEAAKIYVVGY